MVLSKLFHRLWVPSIPLVSSKIPSEGVHDSCSKGFNFLIRLAWESRFLLPIMYVVFSFLFDIHMRLQIIILQERRVVHVEEEIVEEGQEEAESDSEATGTESAMGSEDEHDDHYDEVEEGNGTENSPTF